MLTEREAARYREAAMTTTSDVLREIGFGASDGGGTQLDRRDVPAHDPALNPSLG